MGPGSSAPSARQRGSRVGESRRSEAREGRSPRSPDGRGPRGSPTRPGARPPQVPRAGLTSRRGLGRRRHWRSGAGGRPGHGPGPARGRRPRRRCFVSGTAGRAQPRESTARTEGGGGSRTVHRPRARPFNPSRPARAGPAPALGPPPDWPAPARPAPGFATPPLGPPPKPLLKGLRPAQESPVPYSRKEDSVSRLHAFPRPK